MFQRSLSVVIGAGVIAVSAGAPTLGTTAPSPRPSVVVHDSDREVVEGDLVSITARVPKARAAKRVVLERLKMPVYEGIGSPTWETVRSVAARGRARIKFSALAQQPDVEKLRIRVTYKSQRKSLLSKPVSLKVWSWVPLREISSYYSSTTVTLSELSIGGRSYPAWGAYYGSATSYESRFTPGRNCKTFRGIAGLTDVSHDGATGTVQVSADDQPVWSSPSLTPGTTVPFELALDLPYRFSLLATNTSPAGVRSYPAVGNPELLCSGL